MIRIGFLPRRRAGVLDFDSRTILHACRKYSRQLDFRLDEADGADLLWVWPERLDEHLLSSRLPIILDESWPEAKLSERTRRLAVDHRNVRAIVNRAAYRDREHYRGVDLQDRLYRPIWPEIEPDRPADGFDPSLVLAGIGCGAYRRLDPLKGELDLGGSRSIDVHFAGTVSHPVPRPEVERHRQLAVEAVRALEGVEAVAVAGKLLSQDDYYAQLARTRICLSPWGLGVGCHRDAEAILSGCVLVRPPCDHVETFPDLHREGVRYVACAADFSDLQEVVDGILARWESYDSWRLENRRWLIEHSTPAQTSRYVESLVERALATER